jgi:hypothetical protein
MEKEAINKDSVKHEDLGNPGEKKSVTIKELIRNYTRDNEECYSIKIQDTNTGELRAGPGIPRVPEIERYCHKLGSMWPLQLYCGVRSAELDREIKSLEKVWDCVREVLLGLLNGYPQVGLAEVEKVLRWGDCHIYLVARPPPKVGKVTGIVHNGMGEEREWFYDLVYGIPELLRATFEKFDCENSRQNMERLEKAGHIVANYAKVKSEMERVHPEMMKSKLNALNREKEAEANKKLREEYRAKIHEDMAKRKEESEEVFEKERESDGGTLAPPGSEEDEQCKEEDTKRREDEES